MWMNECRKHRLNLALLAGNDLEGGSRVLVERHLATCPECRAHWQSLKAGQAVLEQARAAGCLALESAAPAESATVWPDLQRQIRVTEERRNEIGWRGWLPAAAMAAASLAIIVISSDMMREPATRTGTNAAQFDTLAPINVSSPWSGGTSIVPFRGVEEFNPERIDSTDPDPRPARRRSRLQRLNEGGLRGL
ncbi:MAG: zf-HC2 domain-containing protein [Planctomycetaceae bacterium]|nr:MAG: zf-HC2 domain-containing protein [Planctomycetaceae bacterium]